MRSVMGLLLHGVRQPAAYCADRNRSTKLPFCTPGPGWLAGCRRRAELGILRVQGRWMLAGWTTSWVCHARGNGRRCREAGIRLWNGPGRDAGAGVRRGLLAGWGGPGLRRRRPSAGVRAGRLGCGGLSLAGFRSAAVSLRRPRGGQGVRRWRAGSRVAGFGQREVRLDLVAVAAAVFVLDQVAGCGQVGDDALRSVMSRLAAMSRSRAPGSRATRSSTRAWLVRKLQLVTRRPYSY